MHLPICLSWYFTLYDGNVVCTMQKCLVYASVCFRFLYLVVIVLVVHYMKRILCLYLYCSYLYYFYPNFFLSFMNLVFLLHQNKIHSKFILFDKSTCSISVLSKCSIQRICYIFRWLIDLFGYCFSDIFMKMHTLLFEFSITITPISSEPFIKFVNDFASQYKNDTQVKIK